MPSANRHNPPRAGAGKAPRFGPGAVVREGPPSEDRHLLSYFASASAVGEAPRVEERRRSPRFPAVERRAWVGWWTAPVQFTTIPVLLEDISLGGARLVADRPLPTDAVVWLCLGIPDPTECAQAKVVAVSPGPDGAFTVRIAFGTPCPQNLYQIAINGLRSAGR